MVSTIIKGITNESQELVDMYLEGQNSISTKASALRKLIKTTKKYDITEINYTDYLTYIKPNYENSNVKLQQTFIKYLFAYNFLKDKSGFENEYWNPEEIISYFEKEKKESEEVHKRYKPALSLYQIEKIQQFILHISEDNYDLIKLEIAFYLCFYTDIKNASDIKEADSKNFKDGIWIINNKKYSIPKKYERYLVHIQNLNNSKLYGLHDYIKQLGDYVGIEKLYPKHIIKAREQMKAICFQCGEKYFLFSDQWASINGKFICSRCASKILNSTDIKKTLN